MKIHARSGDPVECSHCHTIIYHLNKDLTSDTPILGSIFEGDPPVRDNVMNPCPNCQKDWFGHWFVTISECEL